MKKYSYPILQIDIFTPSKQIKVQSQRTHQNKKRKEKKIQRIHAELFILVLAANVVADLQAYYAVSLVKKLNATHCKTHRLTRQFRRIFANGSLLITSRST